MRRIITRKFLLKIHIYASVALQLLKITISVVENLRLADGSLFSIPICLDVAGTVVEKAGLKPGARATLRDFRDERNLAIITVDDVYKPNKSVLRPPIPFPSFLPSLPSLS